jgi:predicted acylesterase/phospholipase RssA
MNKRDLDFEFKEGATPVGSAKELRKAVEASSRIPGLYGPPIEWGADLLIDGVFANNAPVEFALRAGIDHVFVLTSSQGGNVFERPIQSLASRYVRKALNQTGALSQKGSGRRLARLRESLSEIAKLEDQLPKARALDLDALRERYPTQKIHVVHPQQEIPVGTFFRFFGSDPRKLTSLYEAGRREADTLWESEGGFRTTSSDRVRLGSGRPGAPEKETQEAG